jgi:16S rRNA (guanine966-N2)-methyltransferase
VRVIAGSARGVPLRSPSVEGTRPISDRGKEALFSILYPRLPGCTFLDLFGGVGGAGIEALSRGAEHATFVELTAAVVEDLRFNLDKTRLADRATVIHGDAFAFLDRPPTPFDIIFVAQHDPKEDEDLPLSHFERVRSKAYGGVQFGFYSPVASD